MKNTNIKDALGGQIRFHEDLDKVDKKELTGEYVTLRDARVIDDWDSQYGTSKFALLMVERKDGKCVTTLCGGVAVIRQVEKLLKRNMLPGHIDCFLNYVTSENGNNYYVLDWQSPTLPEPTKTVPDGKKVEDLFPEKQEIA